MENEIAPLFLKSPAEASAQKVPGSNSRVDIGAMAGAFAELLQRAGYSLENGLTIISDASGRPINPQEAESAPPPEEPTRDNDAQARDRNEESSRSDSSDTYRDAPRADRHDNNRDHSDTRQSSADDAPVRDDGDAQAVHRSDERSSDQNQSANNASDSDQTTTDSNGANSDRQHSDQNQNAAQNGKENGAASQYDGAAAAAESGAANVYSGLNTSEAILGELLAAAEASFATGLGVEGLEGGKDGAAKAENALQGLAKAIASLGNHGGPQQNQAGPQNLSPELQALAKTVVNTQGEAKTKGEAGPANNTTTLQQQAQSLAQAIGEGNKAQVNVKVTNEAATLVSQPSATLSANSTQTIDGQVLPLRAQQAAQNASAAGAAGSAVANAASQQAALNNAGQNQQTTNQTAQQTINTISADAKAAGPVAPSSAGQGATAGGGEGSSAAGSQNASQETQQSQQSSQAKSANAQQANAPRQGFMDQITVNINRAVQAGLDKINIQLRPESMGRVDVHLEMAKDGKLTAVVFAESKDTLELLSRDAKELTKALQDAGLQLDQDDIEFNLSGQGDSAGESEGAGNGDVTGDGDEQNEDLQAMNDNAGDDDGDIIEDDQVNIRV